MVLRSFIGSVRNTMGNLRLYRGNRLETLARALAEVLRTPLASPFEKEIILVQSKGMERWLRMQIATLLGVCANVEFPFPNAFVYETFRRILPSLPDESPYDPPFSTWRILETLNRLVGEPGFELIGNYLREPGYSLKGLQLSQRIAETFNQYVIYRPELVTAWDAGSAEHWQAVLWRELSRGREEEHRAALKEQLIKRLAVSSPGDLALPQRVALFGISYLPPYHMQILKALSRHTPVHLFILSPCREYWGDIAGSKEMRRLARSEFMRGLSAEDLHMEPGNSLLASMGMQGRDFFELLLDMDCDEIDLFEDPPQGSLLTRIQSSILNLEEGPPDFPGGRVVAPGDRSIQIHSCHSPMREVEVLHDHLLDLFEHDPELMPRDILVMTPDIESYAPFVHAVFDSPDAVMRIPYSIADRNMRKRNRTAETLLAILDLWGERLTAPQVLNILESPPVLARFGLTASDFETVSGWVRDVRIRWGIDEAARRQWSPVAFRENTWAAGVDRLLLGYAMPGRESQLFEGILPFDNIEGGEASILGGFLSYLDELCPFLSSLGNPRSLADWADHLLEALARFFHADEDSELEVQGLKDVLVRLKTVQEVSGFGEAIGLDLLKWTLARDLEQAEFGQGFITGGVTFCSMLPMRSIPFRVLCLIGMNENAFPRQWQPPEFDLMAGSPKPGDRSLRQEDRYLFLEAVLSARKTLYISYTGQSSQDNSLIPPSVLVSELADHINAHFVKEGSEEKDWFLTRHRLQPFNPAYFTGSDDGLFSYSREHLAESQCLLAERRADPVFMAGGLPEPGEAFRTVSVDDLVLFFSNPAKYLLNKRLGIFLGEESPFLEEAECFELDHLEKYLIQQDLVEAALGGTRPDDRRSLTKASGRLPHGTPGDFTFRELSRGAELFAARTEPYLRAERLEPLEVQLDLGGVYLTGSIQSIFRERRFRYRYAGIKPKDHLGVWIPHLVLNCLKEPDYPLESLLIGVDGGTWHAARYGPVEQSEEILARLIDLYWRGLVRPLHFFPESSFEYVQALQLKQKTREEALEKAGLSWEGNDHKRGERQDLYFDLCFRSVEPLDADFEHVAMEVFEPLVHCMKEVSDDA
jgi:exodeoxyribonuclease V gamma subunit